jgi:hypothetical protein
VGLEEPRQPEAVVTGQDAGGQHDLQFGPSISFGLVSPPQLNGSYVNRLALHHVSVWQYNRLKCWKCDRVGQNRKAKNVHL